MISRRKNNVNTGGVSGKVNKVPDSLDFSKIKDVLDTSKGPVVIYRLNRLEEMGFKNIARLPYSIKILLESLIP